MEEYVNRCNRGGPCLLADQVKVPKESYYDYYDTSLRAYIFLDCRIHQKFYSPSLLEIEEAEKFHAPTGNSTFETPDLQLSDQNGVWMTRSDDPECYVQQPFEEDKNCSICDIVCDIRDRPEYLNPDGTCPYSDSVYPEALYWRIEDNDKPCGDFLHPIMLQDIDAINKRRRRGAKAKIWKYLQESHWMHTLINSGQRIIDVWERNYKPVTFYYRSFETVWLFLKTLPKERLTPMLVRRVRDNLEKSPSFEQLIDSEYERGVLGKIEGLLAD